MPVGEERLERAIEQGADAGGPHRPAAEVRRLGRRLGAATTRMLTEWQVYRMFDARRGAWSTFQFLIRKRLEDQGVAISPEGRIADGSSPRRRSGRRRRRSASGRAARPAPPAQAASTRPGCRSRSSISSHATSRGPMLSDAPAPAQVRRARPRRRRCSSIGACSVTAALSVPRARTGARTSAASRRPGRCSGIRRRRADRARARVSMTGGPARCSSSHSARGGSKRG